MKLSLMNFVLGISLVAANAFAAPGVWWGNWGQNSQHQSFAGVAGQTGSHIFANIVYDPFVDKEENGPYASGDLLVHYQTPLVDGNDVFMEFKTGQFSNIKNWQVQTWGERKYSWVNGQLVQQWEFTGDWKPVPFSADKDGPGWEPVYHGTLTSAALWVPGLGGTLIKIDRNTGAMLARINPFGTIDPNTYATGPLTSDKSGNIYYNVMQLDGSAHDPWLADVAQSWLVKVTAAGSATAVPWSTLVAGAPAATDQCTLRYANADLPWPKLNPNNTPAPVPTVTCGSQRPGVNTAPAVAADGTIYDISRASFNDYYGYVIAVNKNLTPKWASSMRNRFHDGCGTPFLPPTGTPGGCRAGSPSNISPPDGMPGSGRVLDDSTSVPVVAPDGSIYYGAYTRYNYAQGHMMRWSSTGQYLDPAPPWGGFEFGWDITPAIVPNGTSFAVITKENHYGEGDTGSYCNDPVICPGDRNVNNPGYPEVYYITSLTPDLQVNWRFQNTNHDSCTRNSDGSITCVNDHPFAFEWCVNAPAVDANGTVFSNSEDGNLYIINSSGVLINQVFTNLAIGAAYTPLSLGPDGKVYTQNAGKLFVTGN
ncbi:MAG TPA: hypothetical protein VII75_14985 [Thermoanaerobaculia bacterium]